MPGSSTTPGRSDLAMVRPKRVAFRTRNGVGTRGLAFAAQWLAYALPYRRFVAVLADANARLGADVDRYSFIVVDLHHLLLAGAPWEMRRQRREQGTVTNRTEVVSPRWQKGRQGSESVGTRQAQAPLQRGESA